jgi:hypothetical protein
MKTTRIGAGGSGGSGAGTALAQRLLDALHVQLALQAAQAVDEQRAVEVVDLVLQRDREEPVGLERDLALLEVPALHEHARRPPLRRSPG